jgi:hypothetical protein
MMESAKKLHWAPPSRLEGRSRATEPDARPDAALSSILRVVRTAEDCTVLPPGAPASAQEWSTLIERVRAAASRAREVEAQAQEQDQRVQDLLERVREDVAAAGERVRAAEARVEAIQAQAEARIRAAEERAEAAEERARIAEEWLTRVHETITSEFAAFPETRTLG